MNKNSTIKIRVDSELKRKTKETLDNLGLTTTQAVTIFLKQVVLQKDLPFLLSMPNAKTRKAIDNLIKRRNVSTFENTDALFKNLES